MRLAAAVALLAACALTAAAVAAAKPTRAAPVATAAGVTDATTPTHPAKAAATPARSAANRTRRKQATPGKQGAPGKQRTAGNVTPRKGTPGKQGKPGAGGSASGRSAFEDSELGAELSPTPYMGWESWFALAGGVDEATVLQQASELLKLGLNRLGYQYVWVDAGWWQGQRSKKGEIEVGRAQWPRGIAGLAETLHDAGLKLGIYTDAGAEGCGEGKAGSYGHYQQDVNTFARWGVDAVKVDFCGGSTQKLNPKVAYTRFHQAIVHDKPHRPMLFEVCDYLQAGSLGNGQPTVGESAWTSYSFGPEVANSWRTETDIGVPGSVKWGSVLRNLDADATHPEAAGPGHWNEPDYLVPGEGLTDAQFRSEMSMWAILAAPLMVSANLEGLSQKSLQTLTNKEVIAVDQDPGGVQGTLVSASGEAQVWSRPLSDGSFAVALFNRGKGSTPIATSATAVGLPAAPGYTVRNLWTGASSETTGPIEATVSTDSTVLLRVYPGQAPISSTPSSSSSSSGGSEATQPEVAA
ncbi:MAG: glycoside hydrolase family 27 protein [Solirubrobacteraceae bacterium]